MLSQASSQQKIESMTAYLIYYFFHLIDLSTFYRCILGRYENYTN